MDTTITLDALVKMGAIIITFWGFYKVIVEIIKTINERHDKEQEWDKVSTLEGSMTERYKEDQAKKWNEYDKKIQAVSDKIATLDSKVEDMSTDLDAKIQEIRAEQCMLTYSMMAVLEGLKQLNCNGPVTTASEKLNKFINKQAHGVLNDEANNG